MRLRITAFEGSRSLVDPKSYDAVRRRASGLASDQASGRAAWSILSAARRNLLIHASGVFGSLLLLATRFASEAGLILADPTLQHIERRRRVPVEYELRRQARNPTGAEGEEG